MGGRFTKPRPTSARVSGTGRHASVTVEDKYTRPTGLYVHKSIDFSRLRKLILAGRLAPCFAGLEECAEGTMEECPICMLVRHCGGTPREAPAQPRGNHPVRLLGYTPPRCTEAAALAACTSGVATRGQGVAGGALFARALWGVVVGLAACFPTAQLTHRSSHAQLYPALNRSKCCNKSLCTGACHRGHPAREPGLLPREHCLHHSDAWRFQPAGARLSAASPATRCCRSQACAATWVAGRRCCRAAWGAIP